MLFFLKYVCYFFHKFSCRDMSVQNVQADILASGISTGILKHAVDWRMMSLFVQIVDNCFPAEEAEMDCLHTEYNNFNANKPHKLSFQKICFLSTVIVCFRQPANNKKWCHLECLEKRQMGNLNKKYLMSWFSKKSFTDDIKKGLQLYQPCHCRKILKIMTLDSSRDIAVLQSCLEVLLPSK